MNTLYRTAEPGIRSWFFRRMALVLTGARQVGKTTLVRSLVAGRDDVLWLNADELPVRQRLEEFSVESLKGLVGAYRIVVIDEVQRITNAGLLLKLLVDNFPDIQVIATGSSALDIGETIAEPLTGRHLLFHLYPFALAELYKGKSDFEVEQQLPFHLIYGNYPAICNQRPDAQLLLKNLAQQYLFKDVLAWKTIRKPDLLEKLLKLLAYQVGAEVSIHELARQLQVKSETVDTYLSMLEKAFIIFRLPAYSTNPRKEVTKMSKVYFWDNGIRNAMVDNYAPLSLRNDQGALWENLMISERMKTNAWFHPDIKSYFWRTYNQSEVDYLETEKEKLSAFEMKWNAAQQARITRAFTSSYPQAGQAIITPRNFTAFCRI